MIFCAVACKKRSGSFISLLHKDASFWYYSNHLSILWPALVLFLQMVHQFLSQDGFKGTKLNAASKGSDLKVSIEIKVYKVFPVGWNVDIQPCCEHTEETTENKLLLSMKQICLWTFKKKQSFSFLCWAISQEVLCNYLTLDSWHKPRINKKLSSKQKFG